MTYLNIRRIRDYPAVTDVPALCDEVERLRAEADLNARYMGQTGADLAIAEHERDQARAVIAKVEAVIESPYWGTHWGEVMVPQPRLRAALRGEGE